VTTIIDQHAQASTCPPWCGQRHPTGGDDPHTTTPEFYHHDEAGFVTSAGWLWIGLRSVTTSDGTTIEGPFIDLGGGTYVTRDEAIQYAKLITEMVEDAG
jgi:hypothetical protein